MNRAYSLLTVKSLSDDERVIGGIATTPVTDRAGDIVEPLGAEFKLPIPLLWQHDSYEPIGHVTKAKVTANGIEIEAKLTKIEEPGSLKDRLDEAWLSIKSGLVRGLSIGFKEIEAARIEQTFSFRFTKWLWLELSAVTIPANADATIQVVKSIDTAQRAATGRERRGAEVKPPGASGKSVNLKAQEGDMKTLAEQITALETKRAANMARMEAVMQKGIDEGRSTDEAEQEEFDNLDAEVKTLDADLVRLRALEANKAKTAKPVAADAGQTEQKSADVRTRIEVKSQPKLEPGIQFARFARCMILGKKTHSNPIDIAKQLYGERDPHIMEMVQKANISAVNTTTDSALFGNEVGVADYVEFLRNQTIVGKFGQNGIPGLRRVPFYYPVVTQATGGTAYWVAEGAAKPMTKPTWTRTELTPLVVAGLAAATLQALKFSSPDADRALRDDLTAAVVEAIDTAFIDPANAGSAGAKPASITNGIAGTAASSGNDADAIRADARAAMLVFVTAKNPLTSGVWIMSGANALGLALMVNALGQPEFPGLTVNGGTFMGLPVIVSQAAGDTVTLVNAGDVWIADDGGVNVDMSTDASLQMVDNPTGTSTGADPVEATLVSMFQTNSVAIRVEKFINWARRRATGVATITSAEWGAEEASS